MKQKKHKLAKLTWLPSLLLLLIFIVINSIITPGFLSADFFTGFLNTNVPLICVTIGCSMVIICGGIDLSVGAIISLVNVVFITLLENNISLGAALVLSVVLSLALGAINGLIIAVFRVNPLLTTFAASTIFSGIALWLMPMPNGSVPSILRKWYSGDILGIPNSLLFIILILGMALLIRYSPNGIRIYAVGRSPEKAYVSGIPVARIQFMTYLFSGLCAGLGALALTSYTGGGDPNIGNTFTLTSIAACVIGGVSLAGGEGESYGAIFGVIFLELVVNTVFSARIDSFSQSFFNGIILLAAILIAVFFSTRSIRISKKISDK